MTSFETAEMAVFAPAAGPGASFGNYGEGPNDVAKPRWPIAEVTFGPSDFHSPDNYVVVRLSPERTRKFLTRHIRPAHTECSCGKELQHFDDSVNCWPKAPICRTCYEKMTVKKIVKTYGDYFWISRYKTCRLSKMTRSHVANTLMFIMNDAAKKAKTLGGHLAEYIHPHFGGIRDKLREMVDKEKEDIRKIQKDMQEVGAILSEIRQCPYLEESFSEDIDQSRQALQAYRTAAILEGKDGFEGKF